jgi:lysophospholipase L1-like esterase
MRAVDPTVRRIVSSILLAVCATVFGLGVVEVALRVLDRKQIARPRRPALSPEDRELPQLRGVSELVERVQRGIFRGVVHRTNSRGVRGPEYDRDPPSGTFRIVVAGDSITMGQGVREEKTYAAVAQRLLNARQGERRYEVINLGVAGFAIRSSMYRLARVGKGYRPHLIVYGFTPNDIMGPEYVEPSPEERADAQALIHRFDESRSKLLRMVWPRLVLARSALWPLPGTYEYELEENYFRTPKAAKQISDALDDLARLAKSEKICAHVFVHTRMNQLWIHPFTRIYRHVADSARERGLTAHISLPFFRGRDAATLRHSAVDPHPNAEGQQLHAEALVAGLDALPEQCWKPEHFVP